MKTIKPQKLGLLHRVFEDGSDCYLSVTVLAFFSFDPGAALLARRGGQDTLRHRRQDVMAAPAHNLATTIPLTNGDNAGVAMGVASGTVMGPSRHLTGAFTVLIRGMPASRLTSMSLQNSTNCPGMRVVPSQVKVLMLAP
ncbi:DUF4150 domain-containing protein [Sorangium sp. So ce1014]|uniref:DUF4150 domain-containing protein n=1 Tax=Sorangium sp. So ce1014 TaxID=3133326 RepID=UPI003F5ED9B9